MISGIGFVNKSFSRIPSTLTKFWKWDTSWDRLCIRRKFCCKELKLSKITRTSLVI